MDGQRKTRRAMIVVLAALFLFSGCDQFSFYDEAAKMAVPPAFPASPLRLTPSAAIVQRNGEIELAAGGGVPGFDTDHFPVYTFRILNDGDGTLTPLDGRQFRVRYRAPHSFGYTIYIEVMDTVGPAVVAELELVDKP